LLTRHHIHKGTAKREVILMEQLDTSLSVLKIYSIGEIITIIPHPVLVGTFQKGL